MPRTKKFLTRSTKTASFYKSVKKPARSPLSVRKESVKRVAMPRLELRDTYEEEPWEMEREEETLEDFPDGELSSGEIARSLKEELAAQLEGEIRHALSAASARLDTLVDKYLEGQSKHSRQEKRPEVRKSASWRHAEDEDVEIDEEEIDVPTFKRTAPLRASHAANKKHPVTSSGRRQQGYNHEDDDDEDTWNSPAMPRNVNRQREWEQPSAVSEHTKLLEKINFLEKELAAAQKRESDLKQEVDQIQQGFDKEKQQLSTEIKQMKTAIEAAPTPQQNKLFTMSTELDQIVAAMNKLVEEEKEESAPQTPAPATEAGAKAASPEADKKPETAPAAEEKKTDKKPEGETKTEEKKDAAETPKKGKSLKKLAMAGAAVIIIVGGIAFAAFKFMGGEAKVDPELIKQYLPEGAQAAAEEQTAEAEAAAEDAPKPEVQGASTQASDVAPPAAAGGKDKYSESQADVSYAETRWETYKDLQGGMQFDYPVNASNLVKTDTSATVIRKTGYIFKVQTVETALELPDYWTQIKARSLRYKIKETTFRDLPALFLELEDVTDYPGDRYLVKSGDTIFDIWYATYSKSLADDDAKRVDVMLNSFKFVNMDGSLVTPAPTKK